MFTRRSAALAALLLFTTGAVLRAAPGTTPGTAPGTAPMTLPAVADPAPTAGALRVTPAPRVLDERADRLIVELPNRLIVIAQRLSVAPVVSVQVHVKTGSLYEQEHVGAGLSHFLEHLLAGGSTTHRTEEQTNQVLGAIGARTNAATSLDTVRYFIDTTADQAPLAIDLLSDWMQNATITPAEYERERQVIQREFEHGAGDAGRIFWKLTQQARYAATPGHPGRHPTIGYLDEFLAISRDEIYDFYKRMYVPNNMVFVVVGDVDPRAMVDLVAAKWADAKPAALPPVRLPPPSPAAEQAPPVLEGVADIRRPRLRLAWPGTRLNGPHDHALDVLGVILGQGETSRLVTIVRDERRLVNTINAYNLSWSWGEGFFGVDAELADPQTPLADVRAAVLEQVQAVRDRGVSDDELARAKRQILASLVYSNQSVEDVAGRLASDTITTGDPDYLVRYAKAIEAMSAADVQAAAVLLLDPRHVLQVTLRPLPPGESATQIARPAEPDVDDARWPLVPLDNAALLERLEAALQSPQADAPPIAIEKPVLHRLPNGLRVVIGRSTLVPAVSMQWSQLGGLLADTPGQEGIASAVAAMQPRGAGGRSAREIAALLDNLGAGVGAKAGNNTTYATAVSLKDDWQTVLGVFADVVLRPDFPTDEWDRVRPRIVAAIQRQDDSWGGELERHFRAAYFGEHVWSQTVLGRAEVVGNLTVDQMRAFHRAQLGAADAVLSVFGDVDPAAVLAEVERLFGGVPAQAERPFTAAQPAAAAGSDGPRLVVARTAKPMAAAKLGFGPGIARTDPDYAAVQVMSRWLSNFPSGELEQALRGRGPGLVYAVGGHAMTGYVPGYFGVTFNTEPATLGEALTRAVQVVRHATTTAPGDDELARAKAAVLADEYFAKQSNADRAAAYALDELYGLGLDDTEQLFTKVKRLDAAAIADAARRRLRDAVIVVMTNADVDEAALRAAVAP